jgi:hypothetical protein
MTAGAGPASSRMIRSLIGAGAMIAGGLVALAFAVKAEGKPLEDVARPLSVIAARRRPSFVLRATPGATSARLR